MRFTVGADVYFEVSKNVPNATNDTLSGPYYPRDSKALSGHKRVDDEMKSIFSEQGKKPPHRCIFYYTTCPKCPRIT